MIPESKICNKCGIDKPSSEYHTRKYKEDMYLKSYCKKCCMELEKKRVAKIKTEKNLQTKFCCVCNSVLSGLKTRFCSKKCMYKRQHNLIPGYQLKRGFDRKKDLVDKFGGCCSICGYSKCLAALHFHHVDPTTKEFELDRRKIRGATIEAIEREAEKCILVCSNCHTEIHHPDNKYIQ